MSEQQAQRTRTASGIEQVLQRPLSIIKMPFVLAGILLMSLLISIVVEWIGLSLFWYEEGSNHSLDILNAEIGYLSTSITENSSANSLRNSALSIKNFSYYWLFEWTGIAGGLQYLAASKVLTDYILATINIVQIFVIRLTVTVLSLPLFLLCTAWGVLEGLIRRDLRRFGVDKERGLIYHESKLWLGAFVVLPIILYFAFPFEINPVYVFPPFALLTAFNALVFTSTLTKHI